MNKDTAYFYKNDTEHYIDIYYDKKRPYAIYNNERFDACIPGEVLKSEYIKNEVPVPKSVYGFAINDLIFFVTTKGIGHTIKCVTPGYDAYFVQTKKKEVISFFIGLLVVLVVIAILLILLYL